MSGAVRAAIVAVLSSAATLSATAQSSRSFILISSKGDSIGTFVVRDSSVFTRFASESGWMSPSMACMVTEGHPAVVARPAQAEAWLRHWLDSTKSMRDSGSPPPGVVTTLTTDTQTIDGIRTRRVRVSYQEQFQRDVWVADQEVPQRLRESEKRFADLMPPDYWRWVHGSPGYTEIIMLYGIPIRDQMPDGSTLRAFVRSATPAWVADVQRSCESVPLRTR